MRDAGEGVLVADSEQESDAYMGRSSSTGVERVGPRAT